MGNEETIGMRLLAVRKKLGLTQADMAKRVDLSVRGWQKLERDEGLPNSETLLRFKNLGFNPGWILSGVGPKHLSSDHMKAIMQGTSINIDAPDELYAYVFGGKVNPDIFGRVWETVRAAYESEGSHLPRRLEISFSVLCYNELVAERVDQHNSAEVGEWLEALHRKILAEIAGARAEPGTGKASA